MTEELFSNIMFAILTFMSVGGAVCMLMFTRVIHTVVAMAMTFLSLAGLYALLNAEFLAFVQILVYAGAMSILMIFGIMLTNHKDDEVPLSRPVHNTVLGVGAFALFAILFYAIKSSDIQSMGVFDTEANNPFEIGQAIFTNHVVPFELMSVLLTVAFIGAIVVAKREDD